MWRYLKEAFWARPEVPGLGRVPVNVIVLAGFGILGLGHEAFWFLGVGLETAYLATLMANDRFRVWVDAIQNEQSLSDASTEQSALLQPLLEQRQERHRGLLRQIGETYRQYRKSDVGEVLVETNRAALDQLALFHLKLLSAQQNLDDLQASTNEDTLRREIDLVRREIGFEKITQTLRLSKQATLNILEKRLANLERREHSLSEIEGDLDRIEAQVALAYENAAMTNQPETISANIQIASHLLDESTWTSTSQPQLER